jgi:outer membrane protein OmpA-like peptidoglycan-associated protein
LKQDNKDFFWPSYVDLMTALFIVMLVLFVLSYKLFQDKQSELLVQVAQLRKIQEIELALKGLEGKYFRFDPQNKRHELKVNVTFDKDSWVIKERDKEVLYQAGLTLKKIIEDIKEDQGVKYLVIIEGMAARDPNNPRFHVEKRDYGYELSYNRALALLNFWQARNIKFNSNRFEIIIAGSGFYGTGRYTGRREYDNKRFLIQVIPKIGKIQ